jgi:hypothetical protein
MAGKDETKVDETKTETKVEPKVETKVEPKVEPKVETKTETKTDVVTNARKVHQLGTDDEIPEDADLLQLSRPALKSRLTRHTKSELRERFGTDDFDDIKKKLDRAAELEAAETERSRAAMTERERLEADLKKETQRANDAERRYLKSVEDRVVDKEEQRIIKLAEEYIDPDYVDVLLPKLAKHLKENFSDDELKKLKNKDISTWFQQHIEKNPKLAKDFKPEKKIVKQPLNNGARTEGKSGKESGTSQQRSFSPNAPNAMSPQEAKKEAAKQGYNW